MICGLQDHEQEVLGLGTRIQMVIFNVQLVAKYPGMNQFTFFLLTILAGTALGQTLVPPRNLNPYKYAEVRPPRLDEHNGKEVRIADLRKRNGEILRLAAYMEELLREKGFEIMPRDSLGNTPSEGGLIGMPVDAKQNRCLSLSWFWGYSAGVESEIGVTVLNCRNETVFAHKYRMTRGESPPDAIQHLLGPIRTLDYQFDENLNHEMFIPQVPRVNETEETIRTYLGSGKGDPIEGIYKTLGHEQKEDPSEYKIGIKKMNGRYCAVMLESNSSIWKEGDVKAYFENTDTSNLFSVTYYLADKTRSEAFAELDDLILAISPKGDISGATIQLFKIYPK